MKEVAILLSGLIAGAVIQSLSGWLNDWRTNAHEHRLWLRERRYEVYTEILTVLNRMMLTAESDFDTYQEDLKTVVSLESRLHAVGAESVITVCSGAIDAASAVTPSSEYQDLTTALAEQVGHLERAMRLDLRVYKPAGRLREALRKRSEAPTADQGN